MLEKELRPTVERWCLDQGLLIAHEMHVPPYGGLCDVVAFRFGDRIGRRVPPVTLSMAIELKLYDVKEVIHQARRNSHFVNVSFAAMPAAVCDRLRARCRLREFSGNGIGLLAVSDTVEIVVPSPHRTDFEWSPQIRLHRNAWRRCKDHYECLQVNRDAAGCPA